MKMIMLLFGAAVLSACSLLARPTPGIEVRERASVCFRQTEDGRTLAYVEPADCYSMRCTRVNRANGTAVLDQREFRLDFATTFQLSETRPLLGDCTPDCAGGGRLEFDLGQLEVGLYRVNLWSEFLGNLSVTSGLPWRDQCLPE